jgi:hypothetical protein
MIKACFDFRFISVTNLVTAVCAVFVSQLLNTWQLCEHSLFSAINVAKCNINNSFSVVGQFIVINMIMKSISSENENSEFRRALFEILCKIIPFFAQKVVNACAGHGEVHRNHKWIDSNGPQVTPHLHSRF